ncbi:hypothetical protein P153DRAFT_74736 [Dothidotthia symphoricarpi CBS 119687]|uniref:Uncharacterized protein n=1 Tax=Dothidotthia symphoricarpi CBS 119687 TaxID=1392245 RepID=A0A6A6A7F9_9PLEO|nr:uncharacterized protein P153DRAFT_74736 [Dothidotthia symphoricarpi CBS 119687]KAF2127004.1 hypothetical protein P153DRAFT_74736 [Dothidotthia symphoricarpi CBS 119687]
MSGTVTQDAHQAPNHITTRQPAPTADTALGHSTASTATPTTPLATTSTSLQAPTSSPQESLNAKLNASDRYWKFKATLRTVLLLTNIIGTGCIAWAVATSTEITMYDESWVLWSGLIPFSISIVWCGICLLVFLVRKRPVHPGARVALDLLLWLGFLGTALLTMVSVVTLMQWGESGELSTYDYSYGYSSGNGGYELADNGTWVWDSGSTSESSSTTLRPCDGESSNTLAYGRTSCDEEEAFINRLWREKPHRINVVLAGDACQYLGLLLHFALFVWACVDTHRHRRGGVGKDAEKLAAEIVMKMVKNGAVIPPPGQINSRPAMGQPVFYPQQGMQPIHPQQAYSPQLYSPHMYPPQMHPQQMYAPQMYPQQMPPNQQGSGQLPSLSSQTADPGNEKTQGPRYA